MRLSVIAGSVRQNRFSRAAGDWVLAHLATHAGVEAELLDLADFPMPFYAEPIPPAMKRAPFANLHVERWTARVAASDGFVFVTPEYNHGTSAVLKNALDYVYAEWNRKPAAFVGYGGLGGARGVEQLRLVTIELQMAPLRTAVHIPGDLVRAAAQGKPVEDGLAALDPHLNACLDELVWWARALKAGREPVAQAAA